MKNKAGFTLVEVLVSVAIIGIVSIMFTKTYIQMSDMYVTSMSDVRDLNHLKDTLEESENPYVMSTAKGTIPLIFKNTKTYDYWYIFDKTVIDNTLVTESGKYYNVRTLK